MLSKFMYMVMPCDLPELPLPIGISFFELEYADESGCYCDVADLVDMLQENREHPGGIVLVVGHKEGPKPDHFEETIQRSKDLKKILVALGYKTLTEDEYGQNSLAGK